LTEQVIDDRASIEARLRGVVAGALRSSKLRLRLAVLLALGMIAAAGTRGEPAAVGLLPVIIGMGIRLWAAGHLHKRQTLAVSGPYRWVRHPLYLGTLIAIVGGCVVVNLYLLIPVALAIMIPVYLRRIAHEERDLRQHFGQAYEDYCARVPRLIPRLRPGLKGDGSRFSFRLALANHWQYGMVVTMLAIVAIDVIEDVLYPWLRGHQPLSAGMRELLDVADALRTGTF
jgi:hypothetical protein